MNSNEKEIAKTRVENPQNFEEVAINTIGKPLYEAFIKGYTIKQWESDPKNLPAHIFKRLPFRKNYSESYFFDTHQGMPLEGYTKIFERLLESDQIDVELNIDFHSIKDQIKESMLSAAQAAGAGKVPGEVARIIKEFTEPKMNWREILQQQIQNRVNISLALAPQLLQRVRDCP